MSIRLEPTLGELRDRLASRCGFGAQIGNLGAQQGLLQGFLNDAQDELWWQFEWPQIRGMQVRQMGVDQKVYDYPDDCEPSGIEDIWCRDGTADGSWWRLTEGINPGNENRLQFGCAPTRYSREQQLRISPVPQRAGYELQFLYKRAPARFTQDKDRCVLPARVVFLHALAAAKAHYRHPDAPTIERRMAALLQRLRAAEHGNRRYNARSASALTDWGYDWLGSMFASSWDDGVVA